MIVIGIDPGIKTGYAVKTSKGIEIAKTLTIWELFEELTLAQDHLVNYRVIVEDARKRKWYGMNAEAKREGAGWIKTLCGQIEAYLLKHEIPHKMIHPIKGGTKLTPAMVKKVTGFQEKTNEHTRDAIMIAWTN